MFDFIPLVYILELVDFIQSKTIMIKYVITQNLLLNTYISQSSLKQTIDKKEHFNKKFIGPMINWLFDWMWLWGTVWSFLIIISLLKEMLIPLIYRYSLLLYTSTESWRGYIFTAVCLSVCVCVTDSACHLVNKTPAEWIHTGSDPIVIVTSFKFFLYKCPYFKFYWTYRLHFWYKHSTTLITSNDESASDLGKSLRSQVKVKGHIR